MIGVYKITNLATDECYIGASIHVEKRWSEHFCKGYGAIHSKRFQEAIDQFGEEGFSFSVIEECAPDKLMERERYWINALHPEYNSITDGHSVSMETRAKISVSLSGKKHPPDVVERRKASIREYRKDHPQTNAGHMKKVALETNTVIVFESVKSCAEYLGIDASCVTRALKSGRRIHKHKVWYVV